MRRLSSRPRRSCCRSATPPLHRRDPAAGIPIIVQVTDLTEARHALDVGANIVVAQGSEAGGHGGGRATLPFVPAVVDIAVPSRCWRRAASPTAAGWRPHCARCRRRRHRNPVRGHIRSADHPRRREGDHRRGCRGHHAGDARSTSSAIRSGPRDIRREPCATESPTSGRVGRTISTMRRRRRSARGSDRATPTICRSGRAKPSIDARKGQRHNACRSHRARSRTSDRHCRRSP